MTTYADVKEWRMKNKEKVAEQARRYRKRHPETNKKAKSKYRNKNLLANREKEKLKQREFRKNNPEKQKERMLRFKLKKDDLKQKEAGRPRPSYCEICNKNDFRIVFDHCHVSGKFRGWLCDRCNRVLGTVKEDVELLRLLINYIEEHNVKNNIKKKECTA